MSYSQKNGSQTKNVISSFISKNDIWKAKVVLDAIKSERKIKMRFTRIN